MKVGSACAANDVQSTAVNYATTASAHKQTDVMEATPPLQLQLSPPATPSTSTPITRANEKCRITENSNVSNEKCGNSGECGSFGSCATNEIDTIAMATANSSNRATTIATATALMTTNDERKSGSNGNTTNGSNTTNSNSSSGSNTSTTSGSNKSVASVNGDGSGDNGSSSSTKRQDNTHQSVTSTTTTTTTTTATCATAATPISDFYRDATLLITGGTGFVGKVLIEKLLRAFELRKIYMLIRCKDNMNVEQRLQRFFEESIFDTIREKQPQLFEKVHPIRVDYSALDLGIESTERETICNEVEIVFNVVASVKFNEKLSDAIDINVLGTKKILDLAMEIKELKSFVHISTLYCNCNRSFIKERVYENEIGYEKIMQIFRIFDDETLEKFRHCLIGEMPNTYTMTKKCAENLVNHRAFYLPAGIFRPPIVMSTYKDPFPGWTDNLYGPSGLCTWTARGLVRCIYGRASCKANMVPADYCVNAMIASAWDIARRFSLRQTSAAEEYSAELPVYNYIFDRNNLTWGQYMHLSRQGFHEPFDKALWCFAYVIIPSKPLHYAVAFFLHHIPAYILDLIATVTGQKRIYIKAYRKISRIIYMMSWFGLKEWKFAHRNIDELDELVRHTSEQHLLQFNIATINWSEYFRSYLSGIRRYFFKDNDNKLQKRRVVYRRIQFVHQLLKSTFGLAFIMCLIKMYFKVFKIIPKLAI